MENKVFTAPLATIVINNNVVGKIRGLTFTENVQRGEVMGIGDVTLQEVPIIAIRCTFTADSYMIDLKKLGTVKDPFWPVDSKDPMTLLQTLLLGEQPVSIHVYRKTAGSVNEDGLVTSRGKLQRIGVAENCYIDSKTWNIQEGNVSGKNISGRYLTPIYQN